MQYKLTDNFEHVLSIEQNSLTRDFNVSIKLKCEIDHGGGQSLKSYIPTEKEALEFAEFYSKKWAYPIVKEYTQVLPATKSLEQQRWELQNYITEKGAFNTLEHIVLEFNKDYADQKPLVFYSWLQSKLKADLGKNYPFEYFSYCVDRLTQLGFSFTID